MFQLTKILRTAPIVTFTLGTTLAVGIGGFRATIATADSASLPAWPRCPAPDYVLSVPQLTAIQNVAFAVSKNPNSLISIQAVALRKGVAMAANEQRIVMQSAQIPARIDTLLMDRLLMLLKRGPGLPIKIRVGPDDNSVWFTYPDYSKIWGAIPAIPWPSSTDELLRTNFAKFKGVKPHVTWNNALRDCVDRLAGFGEVLGFTAKKNANTVLVETVSASAGASETVEVSVPNTASVTFTLHGAALRENLAVTKRLWFDPEANTVLFGGADGLYIVAATMRK